MHLKALTINGFKSFAKKGELEFATPITAIVGPNGSGKSNVAEAFRFVLGEQSVKSMRGKKGEDLIFNGSESVSRSNRASVTIVLDNPERNGARVFPLDFNEIVIERVVHRDGTNEYLINGGKVRLKDVQELLASANIGSTGHHIISQGEADRILTASAKERREMIEDALGLKIYQYKKAESERKLKKTQENIAQVESLRREVAPHLKFLEKQVKKIERSLELQEELKGTYAEYLKREDSYLAFHTDRLMAARNEPLAQKAALADALAAAKKKLVTRDTDTTRDTLVALERNMSSVRTKRQELLRTIGQIEGQILYLERRIAESKKREAKVTESPIPFTEFKKVTDSIEEAVQVATASGEVGVLSRALRDIVNTLKMVLKHAEKREVVSSTEHDEAELKTRTHDKKSRDALLEEVMEEEKKLEAEYEALKRSVETESVESRDAEREVFRVMNEQRVVEAAIDTIDRELGMLERDRQEFKRELQEAASLLGRGAALYFEYIVKDSEGKELSREDIVCEARGVQIERRRTLEKMKIRLEELGMGSSEDVLKEYKDAKERDEFLVHEISDLHTSVEKLEALIVELTEELNRQFITGIDKIGAEFERFFMLMFGGGTAALVRVEPKVRKKKGEEDELAPSEEGDEEQEVVEEGIEIDVKLPNKKVRGLEMLSGGERALTSIALIFAMSQVNPPLFVILDETDAALDEANSRRYGDMITALSERSQLILITHNRETMGRAGVLYGVTMAGDGVSKLLSVKFDEAVAVAK